MKDLNLETSVSNLLLAPYNLDATNIYQALQSALQPGVDSSELYLEYTKSEAWTLDEGIIKSGEFNIDRGFGMRVISGGKVGFAYADELDIASIKQAADCAKNIVHSSGNDIVKVKTPSCSRPSHSLYPIVDPLTTLTEPQKILLLKKVDEVARGCDPRVKRVEASLSGAYKALLVANSDGTWAYDIRPMVQLGISVLIEDGIRKERGYFGGGSRSGYEFFLADSQYEFYAREAVRIALLNLEAIAAPAGTLPIVLGAGWPAVMLHEAVGHGLESDFNRKGYSAYSGKLGQLVANKEISIMDQGDLTGCKRGSLNIDDEGTPTQATLLIDHGILTSYMYDKLDAKLMGVQPTGNGRRASYASLPLPRMTNTFMLNGKHHPEEIIASVANGIYAVNFQGGQVDITSGEFVFTTSEAYLIQNGKIGAPIRGATLIGNGPQVLHKISMVGNNLALDNGTGICGKQGQTVPVGVGQPTLKIDEITVGGTAT